MFLLKLVPLALAVITIADAHDPTIFIDPAVLINAVDQSISNNDNALAPGTETSSPLVVITAADVQQVDPPFEIDPGGALETCRTVYVFFYSLLETLSAELSSRSSYVKSKLPHITGAQFLPYRSGEGDVIFVSPNNLSNNVAMSSANQFGELECRVKGCKKRLRLENFRAHVDGHWFNGDLEPNFCGFCGLSNLLLCRITYTELCQSAGGTIKASTAGCDREPRSIKWASVKKGSSTNPSTNMPVLCKLGCPAHIIIWKREMLNHISQHHPSHIITAVEREIYGYTENEKAAVLKLFNRK